MAAKPLSKVLGVSYVNPFSLTNSIEGHLICSLASILSFYTASIHVPPVPGPSILN